MPDPVTYDAVAVNAIPTIRELEYSQPRLLSGYELENVATCRSKSANDQFERKNGERQLFQELSKYYPLKQGHRAWGRSELLSLGERKRNRST